MEDARADDAWAEDAPAADAREEDARAEDARAEDAPTEDACTEDARVEDEGTGDATTEDAQLNNLSKFSIIRCNNNSVHNSIFLLSAQNSAWLQNHNWVKSPHCTILIDYRCVHVCICVCACVHLRVCGSVCVLVSVCEVLNHCLLNCYRYDKTEKRRNKKRFWSVTRKHRSKEVKRHTGSNFKNPVYLDQTVSVLILRGEIKNEEVCEYFFCRRFAVLARVLLL